MKNDVIDQKDPTYDALKKKEEENENKPNEEQKPSIWGRLGTDIAEGLKHQQKDEDQAAGTETNNRD